MAKKLFKYTKSDGFSVAIADTAARDTKEWIAGQIKQSKPNSKTYVTVNITVK